MCVGRTSKIKISQNKQDKIPTVPSAGEELEPPELSYPAGPKGTAAPENSSAVSSEVRHTFTVSLSSNVTPRNLFREVKTRVHTKICTGLLVLTHDWKQPVAANPSADEWINRT